MKSHMRAGQFKLRGKKSKLLSCGCCEVIDMRDEVRKKSDKREMLAREDQIDTAELPEAKEK